MFIINSAVTNTYIINSIFRINLILKGQKIFIIKLVTQADCMAVDKEHFLNEKIIG